jgi:hypothetical protein
MTALPNIFGWLLLGIAAVAFALKLMVARSRCSGGAPLLDGLIFPPLCVGLAVCLLTKSLSGFVFALPTLVFVAVAYWIAWRLPRINK